MPIFGCFRPNTGFKKEPDYHAGNPVNGIAGASFIMLHTVKTSLGRILEKYKSCRVEMYNDVPAVVHGPALGRLGRVPPAPVSLSPGLGGGAGRGGGLRGLTGRAETKAK